MDLNKMIFVFGSNEAGIHGAGAAKHALSLGASMGVGFGKQGKTFAIPTKNWQIDFMKTEIIEHYVFRFIEYARLNPQLAFQVTCLGCGLAGYKHHQIAPMFRVNRLDSLPNLYFDTLWKDYLSPQAKFWGTY